MIFSQHESPFILVFTANARSVGNSQLSCKVVFSLYSCQTLYFVFCILTLLLSARLAVNFPTASITSLWPAPDYTVCDTDAHDVCEQLAQGRYSLRESETAGSRTRDILIASPMSANTPHDYSVHHTLAPLNEMQ